MTCITRAGDWHMLLIYSVRPLLQFYHQEYDSGNESDKNKIPANQ